MMLLLRRIISKLDLQITVWVAVWLQLFLDINYNHMPHHFISDFYATVNC